MTIDDEVLSGRLPRLGSITTGYAVETTSQQGKTYGRPNRSDTLVLHTNHVEAAHAVQKKWGGDIREDSPNWTFDVVTGVREIDLRVWPAGFRQELASYRAAQALRRCDGVTMSIAGGKPHRGPCACDAEMADGEERACSPHTILPALLELDVELFGVWEIRSTGWGTAANLKGTMKALAMMSVTSGAVPAVLQMQDRATRDASGQVRDVVDLALTIASSPANLGQLASGTPTVAIAAGDPVDVQLRRWSELQAQANSEGILDELRAAWEQTHGDRKIEDLNLDELEKWVAYCEAAVRSVTNA